MIKLQTTAEVNYVCILNAEDEEKVRQLMKEKDLDLEDAVRELFWDMSVYLDSEETDFNTVSIDDVWEDDI